VDRALVGRGPQRAQLAELLQRARGGRGGTALLLGDAGIGKSALAGALARDAAEAGFTVTVGRAWEFADAPPYFPVWPCLRSLGLAAPVQTAAGNALETAFHLGEEVIEALARQSAARPVVWILEDLHAADQQTLELCGFLAEPLHALRALIVGTSRRNDPRHDPSSNPRLSRLHRQAAVIPLEPLSAGEVVALAEQHTRRVLAPESRRRLVELTGGNPLFVVECARALKASGAARLATLPSSVRLLALEQMQYLPPETRGLVEAGAVVGRDFSAAIVARMHGVLPARAIDGLMPALRAGIIDEQRPGDFSFNHVLVRDAIYDGMSAERRAAEHQSAERALLDLDPGGTLVERAHHALCAIQPGRAEEALALAVDVGRRLEAQGAFDRALALAGRAIDAQRLHGYPVPIEALMRAAELAFSAGLFADSRRWCGEALALARAAAQPIAFARAALILGAGLRPGNVDETLVRALQEALAAVPDGERGLRLRLRARLAAAVQPGPHPLAAVDDARDAIAEAHALGDDRVLLDVLFFGGSAITDYAPIGERMAHALALRDVALRLGDRPRALAAYHRLVMDELQSGELAAFERDADELLVLARELGHPRFLWRALLVQSMRAVAHGRFEESQRFVVEVECMAALTDEPALPDSLSAHRFMRLRTMHRDADVGSHAEPFTQTSTVPDVLPAYLAGHMAFYEDRAETSRAMPGGRAVLRLIHYEPVNWTGLAEAVALVGTDDERRDFLQLLLPHADEHALTSHIPITYEGPVARTIGLLHASLGDRDAAEASLRAALDSVRRNDFRPWVARTAYDLAQVLGPGDEASRLLAEAADIADELDLPWLRRRARRPGVADSRPAIAPPPRLAVERRGELWEINVDGRTVRVRDSRGMQLLARLFDQPGEELHVLALASDEAGALADTDAGEVIDAQAARAYRERLVILGRELAEAGDGRRAEKLRGEKAVLERELAAGVGLAGKLRRAGSASERARINVQRRLRDAIRRIGAVDAALGRYLERAVRTGTYCSFSP